MTTKKRGNCYVTCEALYHLLGGKEAGYIPHIVKHEGVTHWYLVKRHYIWYATGPWTPVIIDPTAKQFKTRPDYDKGRGCGFLTKKPSKRAREMMERMLYQ